MYAIVLCTLSVLAVIGWRYYSYIQHVTTTVPCVARAHDQYLYKSELDNATQAANTPEEKAALAKEYIQNWATKQLLMAEAERHSTYDPASIQQRLLEYRYALLVHSYIEQRINDQLDKTVSEQEITAYYEEHPESFVLQAPIFQGKWVVIPKENAQKDKLRRLLLRAHDNVHSEALKKFCFQFAKAYSLDGHSWLNWQDTLRDTPFQRVKNKVHLLTHHRLLHRSDKAYDYYIKIDSYKLPRDVSPLALVKDQIANIIIQKRKVSLAHKIKKDIVEKAKHNNHYVIYDY